MNLFQRIKLFFAQLLRKIVLIHRKVTIKSLFILLSDTEHKRMTLVKAFCSTKDTHDCFSV